jgi:hypothetical protein
MPFQPDEVEFRILRSLEELQVRGCPMTAADGKGRAVNFSFGIGVPEIVLKAWVGADRQQFRESVDRLKLGGLIREKKIGFWPMLVNSCRLQTSDGRVIVLHTSRGPGAMIDFLKGQGAKVTTARSTPSRKTSAPREDRPNSPESTSWSVQAVAGTPFGPTKIRKCKVYGRWSAPDQIKMLVIRPRGLACLGSRDRTARLDELVTLNQMAGAAGESKRTLERWVRTKKLPAADIVGGTGKANLWYWRKVRRVLQQRCKRILPQRFHGSRVYSPPT